MWRVNIEVNVKINQRTDRDDILGSSSQARVQSGSGIWNWDPLVPLRDTLFDKPWLWPRRWLTGWQVAHIFCDPSPLSAFSNTSWVNLVQDSGTMSRHVQSKWQPPARCGHCTLEMWSVQTETHFGYHISDGCWSCSTKQKEGETSHQVFILNICWKENTEIYWDRTFKRTKVASAIFLLGGTALDNYAWNCFQLGTD